jgi:anaerobic magnesium-protoporphyrin IX monomethyl ester cyclase
MLFINPATEQFGGFLSRYVPVSVPIATGLLAAYLKEHGHAVAVIDDEIARIDEKAIADKVKDLPKPYVFGISVLTSQAGRAYEIVEMLKKEYSDCVIIMGGIHVTALPSEGLENGADVVVRGEGEVTLKSLYEALRAGTDWSEIPGISYINSDGELHSTADALLVRDLDEIPMFPYELFDDSRYDMGFITGARGCPYKCSYCSQRLMTGLTYRYHSPKRIVENLEILINKFHQTHITFYDDNFSVNRGRVKELTDAIVEAGLAEKASFGIQTRADNLYDEIMPYLKRANFTAVSFGLETAVERLAEVIVKDQTVQTHTEAIERCRKWGIDVTLNMIFGLPTETREDRLASYEYVIKHGCAFTKFNNLIPYPGTKTYNLTKDTPQIQVMKHWSNFNSTLTGTRSIFDTTPLAFVPEGTTPWQLKKDIVKCNYGFYFMPRALWNILSRKGGTGFVMLPNKWYFKPREVFELSRMGVVVLINYLIACLPDRVGYALYKFVTGAVLRDRSAVLERNPDAIDGTMRKIRMDGQKLEKAPVTENLLQVE